MRQSARLTDSIWCVSLEVLKLKKKEEERWKYK